MSIPKIHEPNYRQSYKQLFPPQLVHVWLLINASDYRRHKNDSHENNKSCSYIWDVRHNAINPFPFPKSLFGIMCSRTLRKKTGTASPNYCSVDGDSGVSLSRIDELHRGPVIVF